MTSYIAYATDTKVIYGIGMSADEAMQDAAEWADDLDGIEAIPASDAVYDIVAKHGDMGETLWSVQNGVAYLDSEIDA